jgi:L-2-hydroxyglutarate oxidase LhgO
MKKINFDDVIVIGGGIIGLSIVRSLGRRYPTKTIRLIEKEAQLGLHNSSMNSGVIHAGLYYQTNSYRAKYCVIGNKLLTEYHKENKIPLKETGKLILPRNEEEGQRLFKLYEQGKLNGVPLEIINTKQALAIEKYLTHSNGNYFYYKIYNLIYQREYYLKSLNFYKKYKEIRYYNNCEN